MTTTRSRVCFYLFLSVVLWTIPSLAQQGNCDKYKDQYPTSVFQSTAKCWYGTTGDDVINVQNTNVVLNGKVIGQYGPALNIFLGYQGTDNISGGNQIDWIYGGAGADRITIRGSDYTRGEADSDIFDLPSENLKKNILDYAQGETLLLPPPPVVNTNEIKQPDHTEENCPTPVTVEYGESTDKFSRRYCPHWKAYKESDIYSDEYLRKVCPGCDPMRH